MRWASACRRLHARVYYIIVTVAFQLIASEIFDNWYDVTGGGLGLRGVPRPAFLGSKVSYYYFVLAFTVVVHALVVGVLRSPIGITLRAVRDNETKARMMGVNPLVYKTFAFVFASALAGLAGGLYAHYLEFAHPEFFSFGVSVDLFLAVALEEPAPCGARPSGWWCSKLSAKRCATSRPSAC